MGVHNGLRISSGLTKEVTRFYAVRAFTLLLVFLLVSALNFAFKIHVSASLFLEVAGIVLILVTKIPDYQCIKAFWIAGGTFYYRNPTAKVVNTGPYRYVRNPLYLTLFSDMFGLFLIFGEIWYLIVLVLMIIGVHIAVVSKEEPPLEKRFGEDYLRYKKSIPRWIPKLGT